MRKGFFFTIGKRGFFVETERKNKTEKFLENVLHCLYGDGIYKAEKGTEADRKYLAYIMRPATLETRIIRYKEEIRKELNLPEEESYYNIQGETFGGAYDMDDVKIFQIA